jgi:anti-sigma factor RsiW
MKTAAHQYEDRLLEFAYGELPSHEASAVDAHVQGCARCAAALADIRSVRSTMRQLPVEEAPDAGLASLLALAEQQAKRNREAAPLPWWRRLARGPVVATLSSVAALAVVGVVAWEANKTAPTAGEVALEAKAPRKAEQVAAPVPTAPASAAPASEALAQAPAPLEQSPVVADSSAGTASLEKSLPPGRGAAVGRQEAKEVLDSEIQRKDLAKRVDELRPKPRMVRSQEDRTGGYGLGEGREAPTEAQAASTSTSPSNAEAPSPEPADLPQSGPKAKANAPASSSPSPAADDVIDQEGAVASAPASSKASLGLGTGKPQATKKRAAPKGGASVETEAALAEASVMSKQDSGDPRASVEAARAAGRRSDSGAETRFALEALDRGVAGADRLEMLKRLCDAFERLGEYQRADPYCDRVLTEFPKSDPAKQIASRRRNVQINAAELDRSSEKAASPAATSPPASEPSKKK